ncbi:MAG: hypothetical protein JXA13_13120 [Anaerolineales bacterium]|nr:hypothetical protein [Anaerolineales bacterium]
MMENEPATPEQSETEDTTTNRGTGKNNDNKNIITLIIVAVVIVLLLAGLVTAIVALSQNADAAAKWRDILIIVMALESLFIGAALIILIIQIASLTNLLKNEVRPILDAASETVNTLRGTTEFLGENVVEPVIKLNGYLAGLQRVIELIKIKRI